MNLSYIDNLTNDILGEALEKLLPVIKELNLSLEVLNLEKHQNIKTPEIIDVLIAMYELNSLKELHISKNQVTKICTTSSGTEKGIDIEFMKTDLPECHLYIDGNLYY